MSLPGIYDPIQVGYLKDECILVDNQDSIVGCASKYDCHFKSGLLHRAFSVFLFDKDGKRLLLQERSSLKITFPGMVTNTCCSHPKYCPEEMVEDSFIGGILCTCDQVIHVLCRHQARRNEKART